MAKRRGKAAPYFVVGEMLPAAIYVVQTLLGRARRTDLGRGSAAYSFARGEPVPLCCAAGQRLFSGVPRGRVGKGFVTLRGSENKGRGQPDPCSLLFRSRIECPNPALSSERNIKGGVP